MPAFSINSPVTMKSGIDISGKELTAFMIRDGRIEMSNPASRRPASAEVPSEKASGIPSAARPRKMPMTERLMTAAP